MKRFAALYDELDSTTSTTAKVDAMAAYFKSAPPRDAAWALVFLTGQKFKRLIGSRALAEWTLELTGVPEWLLEESYFIVGDLAETITLLADGAPRAPVQAAWPEPARTLPAQPGLFDAIPAPRLSPLSPQAEQAAAPTEDLNLPPDDVPLHVWTEQRLMRLRGLDPAVQRGLVLNWWAGLPRSQLFLLIKLLTGSLRVGVSRTLVVRALAEVAGLPTAVIAHRLMGDWTPTPEFFRSLLDPEPVQPRPIANAGVSPTDEAGPAAARALSTNPSDLSRPYPFYLASPIDDLDPASLGPVSDFLLEWKWDGIRSQLIRRGGRVFLWSRGDELITDRFPEIADAAARLPDGAVFDGEVLAFRGERPLPFGKLQRRIGRTNITAQALREAPAVFMAYDLLEFDGVDWRARPAAERRAALERLLAAAPPRLRLSPRVEAADWPDAARARAESRERGVEGLMLKRLDSAYGVGRRRGDWWKWKIDPYAIDAVLVYAQPGHGRRANLLTDYTFAVWDGPVLTPVAKAYSGLNQEEIDELDRWIRQHTTERFGPVRSVEPVHVFELHFEAIAASPRHRSGIAVRFPRIARWRKDKPAAEADTIENLRRLLGRD